MNTTISQPTQQQISRSTLLDLLSDEGLPYECLGAGIRASLDCLTYSRDFYDLPPELAPLLQRLEDQLQAAVGTVAEMQRIMRFCS